MFHQRIAIFPLMIAMPLQHRQAKASVGCAIVMVLEKQAKNRNETNSNLSFDIRLTRVKRLSRT